MFMNQGIYRDLLLLLILLIVPKFQILSKLTQPVNICMYFIKTFLSNLLEKTINYDLRIFGFFFKIIFLNLTLDGTPCGLFNLIILLIVPILEKFVQF
jgi:hypothetical protein